MANGILAKISDIEIISLVVMPHTYPTGMVNIFGIEKSLRNWKIVIEFNKMVLRGINIKFEITNNNENFL